MRAAIAVAIALIAASSPARAEPEVAVESAPPPTWSASLHVLSIDTRGLAVEGERRLTDRYSAAAGLAVRAPGRGDYESLAVTASGELRWWLTGDAPWADYGGRAMVGPYLGGRIDLGHVSTRDRLADRDLGSTAIVAESVTFGYRFGLWRRVEITPSVALGMRHEIDLEGRLAPWTRGSLGFALTAGALF